MDGYKEPPSCIDFQQVYYKLVHLNISASCAFAYVTSNPCGSNGLINCNEITATIKL